MKKKVISALLASTMIVSLVACGSTGGDSSDTNSKSSGTTASSTAGGDEAKDTSSDSGSGDAAGSGDWVAAADEADDAVPGENDDRAFAKFDHVVEVHYGYQIDPKDTTLPDGDSVDNNQYTRYLLDNYNIKVVCDWTAGNASDFQQKVSLAKHLLPFRMQSLHQPVTTWYRQQEQIFLQTSGRSSTSTHPNR